MSRFPDPFTLFGRSLRLGSVVSREVHVDREFVGIWTVTRPGRTIIATVVWLDELTIFTKQDCNGRTPGRVVRRPVAFASFTYRDNIGL